MRPRADAPPQPPPLKKEEEELPNPPWLDPPSLTELVLECELPPHQDRPLLWLDEEEEELEDRLQTSSANLSCRARAAAHSSDRVGQAYQAPPPAAAPSRTRVMVVARLTPRA